MTSNEICIMERLLEAKNRILTENEFIDIYTYCFECDNIETAKYYYRSYLKLGAFTGTLNNIGSELIDVIKQQGFYIDLKNNPNIRALVLYQQYFNEWLFNCGNVLVNPMHTKQQVSCGEYKKWSFFNWLFGIKNENEETSNKVLKQSSVVIYHDIEVSKKWNLKYITLEVQFPSKDSSDVIYYKASLPGTIIFVNEDNCGNIINANDIITRQYRNDCKFFIRVDSIGNYIGCFIVLHGRIPKFIPKSYLNPIMPIIDPYGQAV